MSSYGCPLQSWRYPYTSIPQVGGGTPTVPTGVEDHSWTGYTGTNLANALKIVNGNLTGCYAWASSTSACPTNGRNNAMTSEGLARKVLVIMTDGFSQTGSSDLTWPDDQLPAAYPTYTSIRTPTAYYAPDAWDYQAIDLADRLKKGPDGDITTTNDNVEIYVVGFFCTGYNSSTSSTNWCRSRAAATGSVTAGTHPCPASTMPSSSNFSYKASSVSPGVDELLNNIASSTAGTCDHYFPIGKTESLPQLFRIMAGSIARGRLQ
jgi:hypothetical protein